MSLITEISAIRSMGRDLRDINVPEQSQRVIDKIHDILHIANETQGWHRVDWRSRPGTHKPSSGSSGHTNYKGFTGRHGTGHSTSSSSISMGMNRSGHGSTASLSSVSSTRNAPTKYVSRFKSSSEKIDDTILNTIILGKLNKFSPVNYEEIKNFMCQILDSGETAFLKDFMKLVFQKATTEEIFCPLYAKLLSELSQRYVFLLSEMVILYKEYMAIFTEVEESKVADYDEFVRRTSEKKYRLGYSVFLAELVKNNVLDRELLLQTIRTILDQIPRVSRSSEYAKVGEEYVDCLLKIICALNEGKTEDICKICKIIEEEVPNQIHPYTIKKSENKLTMKARFALLDIYERIQKRKAADEQSDSNSDIASEN